MLTRPDMRHKLFKRFTGRVLDIGCGVAAEGIRLAIYNNCEVYCIDINEELLIQSRKTAQDSKVEKKIEFILADANQLSFKLSYFDVIMFKTSLHHLVTWKEILSKAKGWLKTGGIIYIEEPLKTNPIASFAVRLYYSLASPLLNIHERPDPNQWPFEPRELLKEVGKNFDIEHISYHHFISHLFSKAARYAKHSILSKYFQGLTNKTQKLDFYVQSHPKLQRNCSVIIIQARKNHGLVDTSGL